ncbi:hypothetical protein BpHYR1_011902, partial [Brachionus plicatilis]
MALSIPEYVSDDEYSSEVSNTYLIHDYYVIEKVSCFTSFIDRLVQIDPNSLFVLNKLFVSPNTNTHNSLYFISSFPFKLTKTKEVSKKVRK